MMVGKVSKDFQAASSGTPSKIISDSSRWMTLLSCADSKGFIAMSMAQVRVIMESNRLKIRGASKTDCQITTIKNQKQPGGCYSHLSIKYAGIKYAGIKYASMQV